MMHRLFIWLLVAISLSACNTFGAKEEFASEAASEQKNLKVEASRLPLKSETMVEVFIFTDNGDKPIAAPEFRKGYKIRISLDE